MNTATQVTTDGRTLGQACNEDTTALPPVRSEPLLAGIDALVRPDYHDLNDRDERLLHAVLCAYAKHHLEHPDIGWEQLTDILRDAICEEIGDEAFCKWLETMSANGRPDRPDGAKEKP